MKNLNLENENVQSILHMVVNFGEQPNYKVRIIEKMMVLSAEFFDSDVESTIEYIKACLTMEGYQNIGSYTEYADHDQMEMINEIISDWHVTLTDCVICKPEDEGFKGYYGIDKDGNSFHTFDFEESIGE